MNKYSSIYAVAAEHPSLHAFSSTGFYLYSYELDFMVHKDTLLRADYYAVGDPKEGNDRQKLVNLRAMGKPIRIGYCDVIWKDRIEPIISGISYYKGEAPRADAVYDFSTRLSNALGKLYGSRHNPEDRDVTKRIAFVEVDRVYPMLSEPIAYFFRKTLFPMEVFISDAWVTFPKAGMSTIVSKASATGLYRMSQFLAYEFSTDDILIFGQGAGQKVSFSWDGEKQKRAIVRLLAEAGGSLTKEKLIEALWLEDTLDRYWSVKRSKERKLQSFVEWIRERIESYEIPKEEAKNVIRYFKGEVRLSKFEEMTK